MSDGLRTSGLTVRYGGLIANSEIDLEVRSGEIVGLIGPNGAGKTTFVDAVSGFTASEGTVTLDGNRVDGLPPHLRRRQGLSRTWQSGELFGNLSVMQNLSVAATHGGVRAAVSDIFGRKRHFVDPAMSEALRLVGLEGVEHVLARDLPLGKQKLVGVARALVGTCRILLLDEPAAGLDSQESQVFAERARLIARNGPGILLIDHDMSLVLEVCDRIYVMEFGRVIFSGTPAQTRTDAAVVAAYLGAPMESNDV